MRKTSFLLIAIIGLSALSVAQISDSYTLTPNDLTISNNGVYDEITIKHESHCGQARNEASGNYTLHSNNYTLIDLQEKIRNYFFICIGTNKTLFNFAENLVT